MVRCFTVRAQHDSKRKILDATINVVRAKGYAAATVDDICAEAKVTKGSFFHHFKSKEEMVLSAVDRWNSMTTAFFASAEYNNESDPLQRLLGYIDFREEIIQGEINEFTCFLGTLVQEVYVTHPDICEACQSGLISHIDLLAADIASAKELYAPSATWSSESLGEFFQVVLQGSFIFAKAYQLPTQVSESLWHLRHYVLTLFNRPFESN